MQAFGATRVGLSLRPSGGWRQDPDVRAVGTRLRQSVAVAAQPAGGLFLLLAIAATIPGGVLVLQMAYSVYVVPVALGARAVTTAVLPRMAVAAQTGDWSGYAAAWRQALSYVAAAGLFAACVLVVLSGPIARTLALGEIDDTALVASLTLCLAVLGLAQFASGVFEVGRQALFARLDTRGPQVTAWVAFGVIASVGTATLLLPAGLPRLAGLSAAILLADIAAATTVVRLVRRRIRPEPVLDAPGLRAAVVAAAAMLPALLLGWLLTRDDPGRIYDMVVLLVSAGAAAGLFVLVLTRLYRQVPVT